MSPPEVSVWGPINYHVININSICYTFYGTYSPLYPNNISNFRIAHLSLRSCGWSTGIAAKHRSRSLMVRKHTIFFVFWC
ncbi:hypothetical protein DESC_260015 [Desulfosarcina cetonica]|nr:hypothetical protein DESC_260015 [Desulfosarcina cetonica]